MIITFRDMIQRKIVLFPWHSEYQPVNRQPRWIAPELKPQLARLCFQAHERSPANRTIEAFQVRL